MKNDGFQYLEQRDADDNITQEGVVSKKSAFTTKDNRGLYDVIAENLRYLYANYNDTQIQKMLAEIKSAYNEMKQDPNWGNPSGATMAINAAKEAKTSAGNAKTSETNAKVSETNAKTSETNAKTSETNASESAKKAETEAEASALSADHALQSEKNAKQYADNSNNFAELAQKWAVSSDSPDNQDDTDSDTGKSKSSKEWALQGKRDSQKWAVSSDSPDNQDDTDSDTGKSKSSKEWALQGKRDSQKWAMSNVSPDNQDDTDSQTGKTQSAKSWALQGKADSQKWAMSSNSPDDKKDADSPTSHTQSSKSWAGTSKAWAMSKSSPDNNSDNDSSTGLTQSAKSWALLAKKSELQVAGDAKQVAENTKAVETNTQTVLAVQKNVVGIQNDVKADKLAIENYKNQTKQYLDDTNKLVANKANQMVYKGDVDNYADLPVNALIGDVYNVLNDDTANNIRSGDKFVWTGNKWERIGAKISGDSGSSSQIDLSGYAKLKTAVTFTQVTADKFIGSIDKAINDANGNPITDYISSVASSENKLTFTKGDGTITDITIATKADCNVNPWSADTTQYVANKSLVTINDALYLCIKTHQPSNDFTADLKAGNWKEVGNSSGQTTTTAEPWSADTTQYVANKSLVTYDQSLYLCLVTHTPSSSFEADLAKDYWKKVDSDQTVIGSNSGYSQITKKNITAPKTVSIAINNTPSLCLPPVEILKAGTQETNVSVKINDFSASDEAQFTHEDGVEFGDNGLKLKNNYNVAMTIPVALGSAGYISQSDEIDFSTYKSVEGVDV